MTIVADNYQFVVGVDTHAATHTYALVACPTGRLIDQRSFPTSPAGIARAADWIARRTGGDLDCVLVSMEGTGCYGSVAAAALTERGYRVVEAPRARRDKGAAKNDDLDALAAAINILRVEMGKLCDRRGGGTTDQVQTALAVLVTAREQLTGERTRAVNALTALLRSHDLGLDARRRLTRSQIATVANWRTRHDEPLGTAIARSEAVRLARRIQELFALIKDNEQQLRALVNQQVPQLLEQFGVGPVTAAVAFVVWSYPGRIRSEGAFAKIAGTCPIPAGSGETNDRHRLNRGGDRRLNKAVHTIVMTRLRDDPTTRAYLTRRLAEGKTRREIRRALKRYVTRQLYRTLNAAYREPQPHAA